MSPAKGSVFDHKVYRDWNKLTPFQKVERVLAIHSKGNKGEDRFSNYLYAGTETTPPLRLISVQTPTPTTSRVTFSYTIPAFYTNPMNNLHGAAHALIFDNCTTLALSAISEPGFWLLGGVSRVLDVKYLKAAPAGEEVTVEVEVVGVGGRLASLRGVIRGSDGVVRSVCGHEKVNIDPKTKTKDEAKL